MHPFPPNACDSHIHILDPDVQRIPGAGKLPNATVAQYRQVQSKLGTERVVIVAPSSYGFDNNCLIEALSEFGAGARGIASVAPQGDPAELRTLANAGVRGVRLNLARGINNSIDTLLPLASRIADLGWHLQLMLTAQQLCDYRSVLEDLPVPLVVDHIARIPQSGGIHSPAFPILCDLLAKGNTWLKLSLASSASLLGTTQEDALHRVGRALVAQAPERMLWGSDWPHILAFQAGETLPDDIALLRVLRGWVDQEAIFDQILRKNPETFYDF